MTLSGDSKYTCFAMVSVFVFLAFLVDYSRKVMDWFEFKVIQI